MMHAPSNPSWIPRSQRGFAPISRDARGQAKIAVSTLAVALLLAATVVWLIVAYL